MGLQSKIIVHGEGYDGSGFNDQNSLIRAKMDHPDMLTKTTTMLMGAFGSGDNFPLLTLTEGDVAGSKPIQGIQYTYPFMGKRKTTSQVLSTQYGSNDFAGINFTDFFVVFKERWFAPQTTLRYEDGTTARVMAEPVPFAGGGHRYTLRLFATEASEYCPLEALKPGAIWGVVGGSAVSESLSVGNWSPTQYPGRRKNQISILRESYRFGGNISKRKVEFELVTAKGKSNLWVDFAEYQFMLNWRARKEEQLWLSTYSRNAAGINPMVDPATGQIIPTGAGLRQQIPNVTSYTTLTEKLFREILGDVFRSTPDTTVMDIVLYCGEGFSEEFDKAMKGSSMFTQTVSGLNNGEFVRSMGGNLQLGGYFTSYKTVDGHVVTLKRLPFLDHGGYADTSGRHPQTGRPNSSYEAYFIDHSKYDGQSNVQMVYQEGRMEIRGLEQGMSLIKGSSFGDYNGNAMLSLATERDQSSVHFLTTCGIQMLRDTNSFRLELA
jgi:hypothetical protein